MAGDNSKLPVSAQKRPKRPISPSLEYQNSQVSSHDSPPFSSSRPPSWYQSSSSPNHSLSRKLATTGLRSPHSQLRLQSWGVPGSPNYVTTHKMQSSTASPLAKIAWANESLDSIRSHTSGVSHVLNNQANPVLSPTPGGDLSPSSNQHPMATEPVKSQDHSIPSAPKQSPLQFAPTFTNNSRQDGTSLANQMGLNDQSLDSILSGTPSSTRGSVLSQTGASQGGTLWNMVQKPNIPHSTQPRVKTQFYSLSELQLEESSDSDSELVIKDHRPSKIMSPEPQPWTMQDFETEQYQEITVSSAQYSSLVALSLRLQQSTLWDTSYHEDNPLHSLRSCGFLETTTVDWVALYLQQLVYHSPNLEESVFITLPSKNQELRLDCHTPPDFPWLSPIPPSRMLLPIAHHEEDHYYMFHVVFHELDQNPPAHFYYIDSLGRAPTEEDEENRYLFALELVTRMLPNCKEIQEWDLDTVEWRAGCPLNFRQAPGSVDCGLFLCQALSAVAFDQGSAMENLLPVEDVRSRLIWLMSHFGSGIVQLGVQSSPPVWLLPLHHIPHEVSSSLDNYLDCPGPLVQLKDIYPVIHDREWPLPGALWEDKSENLGFVELPSSSPSPPFLVDQAPILGSPFQLTEPAVTRPFKSPAGKLGLSAKPTNHSSTSIGSIIHSQKGKKSTPNPFLKKKQAPRPEISTDVPKKAMSNPFAIKRVKQTLTGSTPHSVANSSTIHGATKEYPGIPEDPATPEVLAAMSYGSLDVGEALMAPPDEIPRSLSPPPQDSTQAKAPLQQAQLAFSSPVTEGGAPRLIVQRPPPAPASTSGTSTMSGLTFTYGKSAPIQFPQLQDQRFAELFRDLSLPSTEHQPGFVYGTKRRKAEDIYKFTAAEPDMDTPDGEDVEPGIKVYRRPDGSHDQDTTINMSITQFSAFIDSLKDPNDRHKAIMTATKPDGSPLIVNWLKDALPVDRHWLSISTDFDSMSATLQEPEFTAVVNITPWPDRQRTLTTNNGINIWHGGKAKPISHFPNFCIAVMGNNNHFRVNVFMPNYELERTASGQYKTYVFADVYKLWYDEVFLGAFASLLANPPPNLRTACLHLQQELPASYSAASATAVGPNKLGKTAKQYAVSPEIMNLLLPIMRRIVDSEPHLAFMRGFFFHIFGMNLKTAAQNIPGREGDNLMGHTINTYPIINFNKTNPEDLVFDFGVELLPDPSKLPDTVQHVTLLWNQAKAVPFIAPKWLSPRIDAFCGSIVVAGFASGAPAQARRTGLIKAQAYHKSKNETYVHRDRSTGTSFSLAQAMNNDNAFKTEMAHLKNAWVPTRSYGARFEYRMVAWAAMVCQGVSPAKWMDNLLFGETIVAHPTPSVVRFKETLRRNYVEILARTQKLPPRVKEDTSATAMVAILAHCIKSLVKRPDDQSTSRELVSQFNLGLRAQNYGYLCISPDSLFEDLARINTTTVPTEDLGIFDYWYRKCPAGARVKTSRKATGQSNLPACNLAGPPNARPEEPAHQQDPVPSQPGNNKNAPIPEDNIQLTQEDKQWLENLINRKLPLFLWDLFPGRRENPDHKSMQKPFSNKLWTHIARPNVTKEPLVRGTNAYQQKLEIFFPQNLLAPHDSPQWETYQSRILNKLRERARDRAPANVKQYQTLMRDAIFHLLSHWHFLPCPSTRYIWTYSGKGESKVYRVVSNPNVVSQERQ